MEERLHTENEEYTCRCCKNKISVNDEFCPNCGFPLKGTETEQGKFIGQYILNNGSQRGNVIETTQNLDTARNILFVVAAFTLLAGVVLAAISDFNDEGVFLLITNLILAALYLALGLWSKKNAFGALLTGFIIYISIIILNAVLDPATIFKGIIFKVLIISYLLKGVISASKQRGNV